MFLCKKCHKRDEKAGCTYKHKLFVGEGHCESCKRATKVVDCSYYLEIKNPTGTNYKGPIRQIVPIMKKRSVHVSRNRS